MMIPSSLTLRELLRAGNRYSENELMQALNVSKSGLKKLEETPGRLSLNQLCDLAQLLGQPVESLARLLVADVLTGPAGNGKHPPAPGGALA